MQALIRDSIHQTQQNRIKKKLGKLWNFDVFDSSTFQTSMTEKEQVNLKTRSFLSYFAAGSAHLLMGDGERVRKLWGSVEGEN